MQYNRFGGFNDQLLDFFFELPYAQMLHNSQCPSNSHLGDRFIDMNGFSTLKEQYLFLQFVQGLPKGFFFALRTDYKRGIEDLCQSKTFGILATNSDLGNIEPAVTAGVVIDTIIGQGYNFFNEMIRKSACQRPPWTSWKYAI